jgi:hypothetical protein
MTAALYVPETNPFEAEPLISRSSPASAYNPNPPSYRRSTKPSALPQTVTALPPDHPVATRKSKSAALKELAKTVAHPRKTRKLRKLAKKQAEAAEEQEKWRNIEAFLESGRKGPIRYGPR